MTDTSNIIDTTDAVEPQAAAFEKLMTAIQHAKGKIQLLHVLDQVPAADH